MGEGELNGNIVTCPWHGAEFDVKTGEVTVPPANKGEGRFPTSIDGDDVLVELE